MSTISWRPSATRDSLQKRAKIINQIRNFFIERGVLEVETPLLSQATVTAPHISSIETEQNYFLQTSPEYAMKRLLSDGSGAIFQICKAFRKNDSGRFHNPEFTMLEWYRPGFDHHALMDEMDELLQNILKCGAAERMSYGEIFEKYLAINPHEITTEDLIAFTKKNIDLVTAPDDRDDYLSLLLTHKIEPQIGLDVPLFLYDFPASQAALAKIRHHENPPLASRFEVYFKGLELANGFYELQNAAEQRRRFEEELVIREKKQLAKVPLDERFLAALEAGLPDCSGVALGVDRLVMLALDSKYIDQILTFKFENA